jgi:hypothetical protein
MESKVVEANLKLEIRTRMDIGLVCTIKTARTTPPNTFKFVQGHRILVGILLPTYRYHTHLRVPFLRQSFNFSQHIVFMSFHQPALHPSRRSSCALPMYHQATRGTPYNSRASRPVVDFMVSLIIYRCPCQCCLTH